jgi:hypothetical protein
MKKNITAGVFDNNFDFEQFSLCMKYGLNRKYKVKCDEMNGMWPNGAGSLMFFQVGK